jgi:hypothetical protein
MAALSHSGWQVTAIYPNAYTTNTNGDAIYGTRINFITNAGNAGSVFAADSVLTPENVTALINARAAVMDTIATLTAQPQGVNV